MLGHARSERCSIILAARLRRSRRCRTSHAVAARAARLKSVLEPTPSANLQRPSVLGVTYLALGEPDYPVRLQAIDDPPPLIALRGNRAALALPAVGIVGSRNASAAGAKFAQMLARDLADAGFAVVSGLARGIDAVAHRAALTTGTIAVLAGGHDRIYPPEHTELAQALLANGCAISEMPLGWEPRAHDFPRRNRLISGLALGIVVVEAAKRSGSLITARFALEQGREVFAVPGSPLDPRAEGTNSLLKQGATPVTEAADVISVLEPILGARRRRCTNRRNPPASPIAPTARKPQRASWRCSGRRPSRSTTSFQLSGVGAAVVRTVLLELEIAGRLARERGGRVALAR